MKLRVLDQGLHLVVDIQVLSCCRSGSSSRNLLAHAKRFGQYTGQDASSGSTGPSDSNVDTSTTASKALSQRPSSSSSSQRPTSPKPIDDSIIAKYSGRAINPDRPASASGSNVDTNKSASRAPSQRPSSSASSQRPTSPKPIDDSIIAKYSGRAISPDRPASASGSNSRVSSRRPSSAGASQRPGSAKPPIDDSIIAKYSGRAVNPDMPAGSTGVSTSKPTFDDKKVEVKVYNPSGESSTEGTACRRLSAYSQNVCSHV